MKLFAIIPICRNRQNMPKSHVGELPPRYDLAPMNHAAACNWMDACRNHHTDYRLTPWPAEVPHPAPPMIATGYRRDKDKLTTTPAP